MLWSCQKKCFPSTCLRFVTRSYFHELIILLTQLLFSTMQLAKYRVKRWRSPPETQSSVNVNLWFWRLPDQIQKVAIALAGYMDISVHSWLLNQSYLSLWDQRNDLLDLLGWHSWRTEATAQQLIQLLWPTSRHALLFLRVVRGSLLNPLHDDTIKVASRNNIKLRSPIDTGQYTSTGPGHSIRERVFT